MDAQLSNGAGYEASRDFDTQPIKERGDHTMNTALTMNNGMEEGMNASKDEWADCVGWFPFPDGCLKDYFGEDWRSGFLAKGNLDRLLGTLGIKNVTALSVRSSTMLGEARIQILLTGRWPGTTRLRKILIDARTGVPTWEQFIDVTYMQPLDLDTRIIVYDNHESYASDIFPWGTDETVWNLVARNNRFGIDTFQVYAHIEIDKKNGNELTYYNNAEARKIRSPVNGERFPKREDLELWEFWVEYGDQWWRHDGHRHELVRPEEPVREGFGGHCGDLDRGTEYAFEWNERGLYMDVTFDLRVEVAQNLWINRLEEVCSAIVAIQPADDGTVMCTDRSKRVIQIFENPNDVQEIRRRYEGQPVEVYPVIPTIRPENDIRVLPQKDNKGIIRIKLLSMNVLDLVELTVQQKWEIGEIMVLMRGGVSDLLYELSE